MKETGEEVRQEACLRPAQPEELTDIFALYQKRVDWMDESGLAQWNTTDYLEVYPPGYYEAQQQAGHLYVLEEQGDIAAAVVLLEEDERWPEAERGSFWYIHNLVANQNFPGAGKRALELAEAEALAAGRQALRLDCAVDSVFLNAWYGRQGYEPAGEFEDGPYTGRRMEKKLG